MKLFTILFLVFVTGVATYAQDVNQIIQVKEVQRIENTLASDKMEGRKTFTPAIDRAADFIASEFKDAGLTNLEGLNSYKQQFSMLQSKLITASGIMNGKKVDAGDIAFIGNKAFVQVDENSGYKSVTLDSTGTFFRQISGLMSESNNAIVWVPSAFTADFKRLARFNRPGFDSASAIVFVLSNEKPEHFSFTVQNEITSSPLANVVGMIPGKSKKDEFVIFSAHYDHIGIGKPDASGDSVFNGANDDASGTTAVIMLAKYFSKMKNNERSIIFVAFTAEEIGGYGSRYFSQQMDANKAVAMFNIEMIGTDSKWGNKSAYITGYEKSDFGQILQKNLAGSAFSFHPDPYPDQNLFYRSDNATLAALGVPAHTISTSKMDSEPNYHKQSDEVETLDLENMTEIIKSIAISSKSVISGKDTPSRVEKR